MVTAARREPQMRAGSRDLKEHPVIAVMALKPADLTKPNTIAVERDDFIKLGSVTGDTQPHRTIVANMPDNSITSLPPASARHVGSHLFSQKVSHPVEPGSRLSYFALGLPLAGAAGRGRSAVRSARTACISRPSLSSSDGKRAEDRLGDVPIIAMWLLRCPRAWFLSRHRTPRDAPYEAASFRAKAPANSTSVSAAERWGSRCRTADGIARRRQRVAASRTPREAAMWVSVRRARRR